MTENVNEEPEKNICIHKDSICCMCIKSDCKDLGNTSCYQCCFLNHFDHLTQCIPLKLLKYEQKSKYIDKVIDLYYNSIKNFQQELNTFFLDILEKIKNFKEFKINKYEDIKEIKAYSEIITKENKEYILNSNSIDICILNLLNDYIENIKNKFEDLYKNFSDKLKKEAFETINFPSEGGYNNDIVEIKKFVNIEKIPFILEDSSLCGEKCQAYSTDIFFSPKFKEKLKAIEIYKIHSNYYKYSNYSNSSISGKITNLQTDEKISFKGEDNILKLEKELYLIKGNIYKIEISMKSYYYIKEDCNFNLKYFDIYERNYVGGYGKKTEKIKENFITNFILG